MITYQITQVLSWDLDDRVMTTVHHFDADGNEYPSMSGVFPKLALQLEDDVRGHEMILER